MGSLKELKIVIADDSLSDALSMTLSRVEGLRVVGVAVNGVEALELVRERRPDVLILDLSMPLKDGITVLEELRAEDTSTVVVVFTADTSLIVRKVCMDFGADYFLDKSEIAELIEICSLHLPAL